LELFHPCIPINLKQSKIASKGKHPIIAEILLHCTLRYLLGGSYHDIHTSVGFSSSSFYTFIYQGINTINSYPQMSIKILMTVSELQNAASQFDVQSSHGIFNGGIGLLDSWLCRIRVPSPTEARRLKDYFSGHFQCYGLNVQATCDTSCYFTSLLVLGPRGTSEHKAFFASNTYDLVQHLLDSFYVVADNAYCLSYFLLISYSGKDKSD
jgi:hypothetical protein